VGKLKVPFRKHPLKPLPRPEPLNAPRFPEVEPTRSDRRGYFPGSLYSALERQWLRAVEQLQKREGRKFLAHCDYLRLAIALGWITPPPTPRQREDVE